MGLTVSLLTNKKLIYLNNTYSTTPIAKASSNFTRYFNIATGFSILVKNPLVNLRDKALITMGNVKAE